MGKISNLLSKGMSENDKKELQQALTQLNHLNAKLTAKYTLANDLEHIKDGRTAAAKLIKSEIEQLRASINEVVQLKTELKLEIQNILSLKQKIDNFIQDIKQYRITNLFYLPINSEGKYAPHELGYIAVLDKTFSLPRSALNISQHVRSLNQFFSYLFTFKLSIHLCRFHDKVDRDQNICFS